MPEQQYQELTFDLRGRKLAAKRWGAPSGIPTFAFHGWLDNASSFDLLAPGLPELDLVVLDFAGHGRSEHRHPDSIYMMLTYVQDVLLVAEQLGWDEFTVIGHSMGAHVGFQLAGLLPERVKQLVCIDGFAFQFPVEKTIKALRQQAESVLNSNIPQLKTFDSLDDMAERVAAATDHSQQTARVLVERGSTETPSGLVWSADPRLRKPGGVRMLAEQIEFMTGQITAEVMVILASKRASDWFSDTYQHAVTEYDHIQSVTIEGPHHVHISHPEPVRQVILEFLKLL